MIDSFRNNYFFLSNFWPGDQTSLEMKYQAAKFLDPEHQKMIMAQSKPGLAKRHARYLKSKGYQRLDWEQVNLKIMEKLLKEKFSNPTLAKMLIVTGDQELIEGNWWGDDFWGCIKENGKWIGENHLGKLLMKIRSELINAKV